MFYIYKFENKISGKLYIGKATDPYGRYHTHMTIVRLADSNPFYKKAHHYNLIHKAITKYGPENFDFIVIDEKETEKEILELEKYYIALYKTNVMRYGQEAGYNLTDGGEGASGRFHTEEAKQKIRAKAIGRLHTEETKEQISKTIALQKMGKIKLSVEDAFAIKQIREEDNLSYAKIAKQFGVSKTTVMKLCKGQTWKYLDKHIKID